MRAAGDLARSDRLAADDVQHLSQGTPRRKVPKLQETHTPNPPRVSATPTTAGQEALVGAAWVMVAEPAYLEVVGTAAAGFALA